MSRLQNVVIGPPHGSVCYDYQYIVYWEICVHVMLLLAKLLEFYLSCLKAESQKGTATSGGLLTSSKL